MPPKLWDFDDYKKYVQARVRSMPKNGRGEYQRISQHLRVHTTMVSQVFSGTKDLTLEQACALCDYFGLSERETDYFLNLVQRERAGTHQLKQLIERRLAHLRAEAKKLSNILPRDRQLSEQDKAVFYSSWYYSGTRLLTSVPKFQSIDAVADHLKLPKSLVRQVVDFLLTTGLCAEEGGRITMGPRRTHLEAESPLIGRHHMNWRLKAIERHPRLSPDEIAFSAPMSIGMKDGAVIRKAVVALIERVSGIVKEADPEKVACLNIDWFDL